MPFFVPTLELFSSFLYDFTYFCYSLFTNAPDIKIIASSGQNIALVRAIMCPREALIHTWRRSFLGKAIHKIDLTLHFFHITY